MGRTRARAGGSYSIRVVSTQTGIPPDTLRVWERRYGFPRPARRPGGGRLYNEDEVARLRLIARARDAGYRPTDIIPLPDDDIVRLIETAPRVVSTLARTAGTQGATFQDDVAALVKAVARDDVGVVRGSLRGLSVALGPRTFVTEIAHPFALAIGDAWASRTIQVRHEHVATALLSMQLRLLLSTYEDGEDAPVVLLATLPGEAHGLALELVALYLATSGVTPRLLGADTPPEDVAGAAVAMGARVVGVSVSGAHDPAIPRGHLSELVRLLEGRAALWAGGAGASEAAPASVRIVPSWPALDEAVATMT